MIYTGILELLLEAGIVDGDWEVNGDGGLGGDVGMGRGGRVIT